MKSMSVPRRPENRAIRGKWHSKGLGFFCLGQIRAFDPNGRPQNLVETGVEPLRDVLLRRCIRVGARPN